MVTHLWSWGSLLPPDHEWGGESSYVAASHGRWLLSWDSGSSCWCTSPCPSTRRPDFYLQPEPGKAGYDCLPKGRYRRPDLHHEMFELKEMSPPDRDFLHMLCISLHSACWSACTRYCPCPSLHPLTPSRSAQWQRRVIEKGYDRCAAEGSISAMTDV